MRLGRETRACKTCGSAFDVKSSDPKRYCTHGCYARDIKGKRLSPPAVLTCAVCTGKFEVRPSEAHLRVTCSRACHRQLQLRGEQVECPQCGTQFYRPKSYSYQKYCSHGCYSKAIVKPRAHPDCLACGRPLGAENGYGPSRKFCSKECRGKGAARKVDLTCRQCGKVRRVSPYYADRKFCGKECWQKYGGPTDIEEATGRVLSEMGLEFIPQFRIGRFVADFMLPSLNLVIETDGEYWHGRAGAWERDRRKDAFLQARGLRVLRIPGSVLRQDARFAVTAALRETGVPLLAFNEVRIMS